MFTTSPTTLVLVPLLAPQRRPGSGVIARGQSVISMGFLLVLLSGLTFNAWDNQNRQPEPYPVALAALQGDEATPAAGYCAPPPPAATEEEILAFSTDDWPTPQYAVTERADEETTDQVIQLFEDWYTCGFPDAYWSTRALNRGWYYDQLNPEQQAAIDAYLCIPREQDVMQHFPLTLNQGQIDPIWEGYPYSLWENADVYVLADGRYGMAMGRLTTDIIRDPSTARAQDTLWFVAFVEENGQLYIDDSFYAFSGDPSLYSYGQMTGDCD